MGKVLKDKYTRSDLDELAEEEKRAWLEVLDGEYGEELPPAEATTAQTLTSTTPTTSPGQQPEESLSIPPLTGRPDAEDSEGGGNGEERQGYLIAFVTPPV